MGKKVKGIVIEKAYHPPAGAPDKYWCYLTVETKKGKRVVVRLHQKLHNKITTGDAVSFSKPWRKDKRVRDVTIISRADIE